MTEQRETSSKHPLTRGAVVLVFLIFFSPIVMLQYHNSQQRQLIKDLSDSGAEAILAARGPELLRSRLQRMMGPFWMKGYDRIESVQTGGTEKIDDQFLDRVSEISALENLRFLAPSRITPAGLEHLSRLKDLKFFQNRYDLVTDEWLAPLGKIHSLELLIFQNSEITDAGLQHLADLESLTILTLNGTGVTDQGLQFLRGMSQLKRLDLGKTQITDEGLLQLSQLKNLQTINLDSPHLTEKGVRRLKAALPDCKLYINEKAYIGDKVYEDE